MNSHAIRYRTYKMLLEVDLTPRQRDELMLNEDLKGIISGIADFLKGGVDAIKRMGAGVAQAFEDPKTAKELETSKDTVKDLLQKLKGLAPKGVDQKAFVANVLNAYLNSFGVKPEELANPKPVGAPEGGKEGKQGLSGGVPPGDPVEIGKSETSTTVAAAAAEVAGKAQEKAIENSKDMKQKDVIMVWVKAISEKTGVKEEITAIIIDELIKQRLIVAESFKALKNRLIEIAVFSRWELLAGIKQKRRINEAVPDDMPEKRNAADREASAKFKEKAEKLPKDFNAAWNALITAKEKDESTSGSDIAHPDLYANEFKKIHPFAADAIIRALATLSNAEYRKLESPEVKKKVEGPFKEFFEQNQKDSDYAEKTTGHSNHEFKQQRALNNDVWATYASLSKSTKQWDRVLAKFKEKSDAKANEKIKRLKKTFPDLFEKLKKQFPDIEDADILKVFNQLEASKIIRLGVRL